MSGLLPSSLVSSIALSQKQILRQGFEYKQYIWEEVEENISRGVREGKAANKKKEGALSNSLTHCEHLELNPAEDL